jgi:signal transduction histidine kinase/ActR/RegA family two-component response regulator
MLDQNGPCLDFRALFEAVPGRYLVLAPDLTIIAVSDAYTRMTMTVRGAIVGRAIFDVFPDNPDNANAAAANALRASLDRVLETGRPDSMPQQKFLAPRPITEGGGFEERHWCALNAPVFDGMGELRWIIHRVQDVTDVVKLRDEEAARETRIREQQRTIEQLRASSQELARRVDESASRGHEHDQVTGQHADLEKMEAVGNVTGSIAHDFNNLLAAVLGNLEMLGDQTGIDTEGRELLGEAQRAAARGADLARRLLAFARRQPLKPARIDIDELVEAVGRRLERGLGRTVRITLDLAPDLWAVMADPALLETSLANMIANAGDAMPNGGHLIIGTRNGHLDADYVSEHPGVQPGDYAIIEVSDTGSGMSRDVQRRIFEPFFTTKDKGTGRGLGLSTVLGFVKQSGGHVDVASEEGVGTTFRLYLPRLSTEAPKLDGPAPATSLAKGESETVLVVEDDPNLRRVVRRQLLELGYQVLEAERAAAALRLLEAQKIDLLFTDIVTPGSIDGMALARTAAVRWPGLKILLTSGFPQAAHGDEHGGAVNGMRLLSKPYGRDELARVLREVLGAPGRSPPAAERVTASAEKVDHPG